MISALWTPKYLWTFANSRFPELGSYTQGQTLYKLGCRRQAQAQSAVFENVPPPEALLTRHDDVITLLLAWICVLLFRGGMRIYASNVLTILFISLPTFSIQLSL